MAKQSADTKHKREKDFIRKPKYEGGTKALNDFISANLVYPADAIEKKIQGDVHIKFDVNEKGEVLTAKVARAIGGGCDEEALRVVRMLKYIPARNRKVHVTTHNDIVIHFRLPVIHLQPVQHNVQMNYSFVPLTNEVQIPPEEKPSTTVFTWTVQRKPN